MKRSAKYVATYHKWVEAQTYLNWTAPFYTAYHYKKAGLPCKLRVQLIEVESLRGAVFFYDPSIGAHNFGFFFELLSDRVKQHGYTLHSENELQVRHERYTEQVKKLLFTPPASDVPGSSLCNQLYGNVLLDYVQVNNYPGYIRFATNSYQDTFFSKPLPFEELLEKILRPQEKKK
ncbi:hypothetical protein PKOR_17490 [Pontibacter korlensis]|uniref:Uncharacterized protein n=1 Tax=Pontibacter korlensis TaxID=400092 RepID=A0A0E3ZFU5_9BACT|nr:hypothetical protein [Pontibacter korlensis]AKD04559.1 hypothetical protein PKOR_17490 [Pontibacter korlensis]